MMELTFVNQYGNDAPKRRRHATACAECRRSKVSVLYPRLDQEILLTKDQKRCKHFAGSEEIAHDQDQADSGRTSTTPLPQSAISHPHPREQTQDQTRPNPSKHFVSDLLPESVLLGGHSAGAGHRRLPTDDIGIWIDRREYNELIDHRAGKGASVVSAPTTTTEGNVTVPGLVAKALIDIYFARLHPILPMMDEADYRSQYAAGRAEEPLCQAMCLVAAKHTEAQSSLWLDNPTMLLTARDFCSKIYASIMAALRVRNRYGKVTSIQILALMSLHHEGPEGAEEASMSLTMAMHHAQTLGIHLGQPVDHSGTKDLAMKRLFWCLYCLDRTNSAINGRPICMSDIDIAIEPFAPGESGFPGLDLWLRVTQFLNHTIGVYRPSVPPAIAARQENYPDFEEVVDEAQAWELPQSVLATAHLYFLTVNVLCHRSRSIRQMPRGTPSSIRQRLCAIEIIRLFESEHCRDLHALPVIPYAVALALSVSYQHFRQSQLQHQQEDAKRDFRRCCDILQSLRNTWSSADSMATLGKRVLDELDKAPSLSSFRIKRGVVTGPGPWRVGPEDIDGIRSELHDVPPCPDDINGARSGLLEALPAADAGAAEVVDMPADAVIEGPYLGSQSAQDFTSLFDGMDDIFGTYLDPNYPVNLDDFTFGDELQAFTSGVDAAAA